MGKKHSFRQGTPFMELISYEPTSGCWLWNGSFCSNQYGYFTYQGKSVLAHRRSYEMHKGAIPEGLTIDHLCRNVACVNPDHLEAVTMRVNLHRGTAPCAINAKKTHCPRGHALVEGNTDTKQGRYGMKRECSTCRRAYQRERYAAGKKYKVIL